jgi:hypothetical protein
MRFDGQPFEKSFLPLVTCHQVPRIKIFKVMDSGV